MIGLDKKTFIEFGDIVVIIENLVDKSALQNVLKPPLAYLIILKSATRATSESVAPISKKCVCVGSVGSV